MRWTELADDYRDATPVGQDGVLTATRPATADTMTQFSLEDATYLADAFWHVPDVVVMVRPDGKVAWANGSAERLFGASVSDWVGRSSLDMVHPDDTELVLRSLSSIQDKEIGDPIEIRVRSTLGWRLVEIVGTTVPWFGQRVVLLCLRDLTERRRFELGRGDAARFHSIVHNAGTVILAVSPIGTIESVSGAITRILGHDPEMLEGRPLADIVAPEDRGTLATAFTTASRGSSSAHPVIARVGLLGYDEATVVPFEISIVDLIDDPTVQGFVISAHDASSQVRGERELSETLSLLTATLESTADGILVVDAKGRVTGFNGRFAEIWRIPENTLSLDLEINEVAAVMEHLVAHDVLWAPEEMINANREIESFDTLEFNDGRVVERYCGPQLVGGAVVGHVWSFRDVTDRKRLEDELAYRAFHDSLTGLANKALFSDRLEHALARSLQTGSHLAVLFVDLDNFKTVNDSLGHTEGDQLLIRVASTLVECLRPLDTAARMGGDEFAILIEDVPSHDAVTAVAQRILDTLRPAIRLGSKAVSAAGSIGIAFEEPGVTAEQLLRNADIAMYKAKAQGKDRFEVYQDDMHASVLARIELEDGLKAAIFRGDLLTHFQPIIDLATRQVVGFEALVRWPHPRDGLVDPRLFVPLAEELGLIEEIDSFVLELACRQARRWRDEHPELADLVMSVNISAGRLTDPALARRITDQVASCGFETGALILEITESAALTDDDTTVRNLADLRAKGVRIALDDFGTGYSSFSHLGRLQIDIVKIDRSFVEALGSDNDDRSLVAAMVQLAGTLGYQTIAEGVENAVQEDALRMLGCSLAQGYHLGRPLEAEVAGRLLDP
jgi:diguanylate cyclase (GGDEF)-like protein/PAS domain S-box-containing protein